MIKKLAKSVDLYSNLHFNTILAFCVLLPQCVYISYEFENAENLDKECSTVVEYFSSMLKDLGLISSTAETKPEKKD